VIESSVQRIRESLSETDLVLDVGGWAKPFARADWVLDLMPYRTRGMYGYQYGSEEEARFSEQTWVVRDICQRESWPFRDNQFDFAICSHTLEDLRDPIWACSELARVARAGYIEVPSRVEELTFGIHGPWVGWAHHHWLIQVLPGRIEFVFKTHAIHGVEQFHLPGGFCDALSPEERVQAFWWEGSFEARERPLIGAEAHDAYMIDFVSDQLRARPHPRHGEAPSPIPARLRSDAV